MERNKKVVITITSILVVLVLIVGVTYALEIFQSTSGDNTIKSGKISMNYTESSNVINITNALPMTDEAGKQQTNYFDFSITSNAQTNADDNEGIKIPYNLIIEPKTVDADKDALSNNEIKVYLTKVESGVETKIMEPVKISELTAAATNFNLYSTENVHKNGNGAITTKYRLRAWIDYNVESKDWTTTSKKKQYKFAVNVNATGELNGTTVTSENAPNPPLLTENMIAVYYDESDDNWKKADVNNSESSHKWYDYDNKMWANAVTVSSTNRSTYLSAGTGTIIPMEDINAMFVWIPRYKYTYFASNTQTEIPITFENGVESTGTISCTDAISTTTNKSETCTDTTNGSLVVGTSTYTHPAFTFGDEELTGIWVGKFENSATEIPTATSTKLRTVIIKPDVQSWRYTPLSYFVNSIRNMELANNIYGFPQNETTINTYTGEISGDSNNLDTHMMKNMEWGAVSYLSHSKYGKNSEVFINNSGNVDGKLGFYTGRSGGNEGGSTRINETYTDQTSTTQYNTYGFYTYDGYLLKYDTNEKSTTRDLSKVASTTGNIYGVYDMSGGAWEYVMANMMDENNVFYPAYSETWTTTDTPLDKYYDKYSYGTSNTEFTRGKLGDATIEMDPHGRSHKTWYDDNSYFLKTNTSWLTRGVVFSAGVGAGVFGFYSYNGSYYYYVSSRTTLSVTTP